MKSSPVNPHRAVSCLLGLLAFLAVLPAAQAQWRTQQIQLQPGWNAVFLEVEPEPAECETVFSGVPVESVWMYNQRSGAPQFVSDPRNLTPVSPDWLVYVPGSAPGGAGAVSTLFAVPGGRPYLVKLGGTTPVTWSVKGRPRVRPVSFVGQAFNFVGFHIDPAANVSVANFFSPAAALAGQAVYELDATGEWKLVANPASTNLRPGRAYWVFATAATRYSGPLGVTPDLGDELAFGPVGRSVSLRLENFSAGARRLTLRVLGSEAPPAGDYPADAGPAVLGFKPRSANAYSPVTAPLTVDLGPGQSDELTFELRRQDMAAFLVPPGSAAARYQGLLEVTDGFGQRYVLPVSAESNEQGGGVAASASRRRVALARQGVSAVSPVSAFAGLWAGVVSVDKVNDPRHASAPALPRPAGADFQFRVLLHVDAAGGTHLLREALILFKKGIPATGTTPATPGEYVIATDESLLGLRNDQGQPIYTGSTMRDGVSVGQRLSSVNFSFIQPLPLVGEFGAATQTLNGNFPIPWNDPLHPFKHLYHPDHDNLNREFKPYSAANEELWDLTRELTFEFTATDPNPNASATAGFGSVILAGLYRETITGLHKDPLRLSGIFRLQRVLNVNRLNDGR